MAMASEQLIGTSFTSKETPKYKRANLGEELGVVAKRLHRQPAKVQLQPVLQNVTRDVVVPDEDGADLDQ